MRVRSLLFISLFFSSSVAAWDQSILTDVRFSADGRYFSFVEFVEPEAEEQGYAAMYVIDTAADGGTRQPALRVDLDGEGASGERALVQVRADGRSLLDQLGLIDANPAVLPFQEVDRADPYNRRQIAGIPELDGRLELTERPAEGACCCSADGAEAVDFTLVLDRAEPLILATYSGALQPSLRCPEGYDIAAAFLHESSGQLVLAVLVGVYTPGWEGSDRHLIAVTKVLH